LNCCLRLIFLPKQDVVVALTSPPLISFLAAWFTKLRGGELCYWVMDLNPDEAIAAGWLNRDSFVGRWLERFSRFSFRSATRIIALDRFMRDRIVAKGIAAEKISVIPPWSHDDHIHFDAVGREQFRATHGLQDKFVVMYSGNHSPCHPLDTLLDAARKLSTLNSQPAQTIVFCFVGGGSEFKRVQTFKKEHALANILCLPYQPLDELSGSLSAADLHVVAMGNPFVGIVHPCKIYNILTVGAPVLYLGPTPSHVAEILAGLGADYPFALAPHGDVSGMVEQILSVRAQLKSFSPGTPPDICRRFSRSELLPQMVAAITGGETTHP
jgi:glycosyltransferase involved in cell wall biosynthesis